MKTVILIMFSLIFINSCDDGSGTNNSNNSNNTNNVNNSNNLPPERCIENPSGDSFVFTEVTNETLLGTDGLHLLGNRLGAIDINNDGFPEILAHKVNGGLRDATDVEDYNRGKHLLLNIEDPQNPGKRIFQDITSESGYDTIPETGERGRGASWALGGDFNGDGIVDLVSGVYGEITQTDVIDRTILLIGDNEGHFAPIEGDEPFNDSSMYSNVSASAIDYDKDGQLDLFLGYFYRSYGSSPQQDRLFKNLAPGYFRDESFNLGMETFNGGEEENINSKPTWGVTACDINGDGWTDLLSSNYGRAYNMMWLNSNGTKFVEDSLNSGAAADELHDWSDNQFYICHCVLNPGPECTEVPPGEQKISCTNDYWNVGFDDQLWRNGGNTGTTVCADFNNDGLMDLYNAEITHWHIGSSSDESRILINTNDGTPLFTRPDVSETGLDRVHDGADWNQGDIYALAVDLNNDSLLDIVVGDTDYPGTKLRIYIQNEDHTFTESEEELGVYAPRASGITWLDYDQDGDYDLLVGFSTMRCTSEDSDCIYNEPRVRLFRNDGGSRNNKAVFRLMADGGYGKSNTMGIGAVLNITVNGVTFKRELQSGYGHNVIQTPLEVSIGLGENCIIEKLEIEWPNLNGTTSTFENIPANYTYFISENDGITSWNELPIAD